MNRLHFLSTWLLAWMQTDFSMLLYYLARLLEWPLPLWAVWLSGGVNFGVVGDLNVFFENDDEPERRALSPDSARADE